MAAFTKSKELMQLREKQEGEKIDMCKALQDWAAEERKEGISALVNSLKYFIKDEEILYQAVIKNEIYKNVSREEVLKYLQV